VPGARGTAAGCSPPTVFELDGDRIVVIEVYDGAEMRLAPVEAGGFDGLFAVTAVQELEIIDGDAALVVFLGEADRLRHPGWFSPSRVVLVVPAVVWFRPGLV
jgi:hypothetical protein